MSSTTTRNTTAANRPSLEELEINIVALWLSEVEEPSGDGGEQTRWRTVAEMVS